jgi:small-conductance mechanosensitive channel
MEDGTDTRAIVTAALCVAIAVAVAFVVDRAFQRRGRRLAEAVLRGQVSREIDTRLRFLRRLVYAGILLIGLVGALSQFAGLNRIAASLLASGVVAAAIIGFAARQTLANGIAGILLAITQPIRIGDLVTFEEQTGVVEDVKLTYTYIRLDDGRRLIVPNERLAQSSVLNHTILDPRVQVEVSVWLPPDADLDKAMELIRAEDPDIDVSVVEVDKDGVRLSATTWASSPSERGKRAAELRLRWLRDLREHALSSSEA